MATLTDAERRALPDKAFLYIGPADGERRKRLFPVFNAKGELMLGHAQAAVARAYQAKIPERRREQVKRAAQRLVQAHWLRTCAWAVYERGKLIAVADKKAEAEERAAGRPEAHVTRNPHYRG